MARTGPIAALVVLLLGVSVDAVSREAALEPSPPSAVPTIEVTPTTVIALGASGDELSIEEAPNARSAIVLINPYGEDCTLRFSLDVGESLVLRTASGDGRQALCELGLVSIVDRSTARFAYSCSDHAWTTEPKCSVPEAVSAPVP